MKTNAPQNEKLKNFGLNFNFRKGLKAGLLASAMLAVVACNQAADTDTDNDKSAAEQTTNKFSVLTDADLTQNGYFTRHHFASPDENFNWAHGDKQLDELGQLRYEQACTYMKNETKALSDLIKQNANAREFFNGIAIDPNIYNDSNDLDNIIRTTHLSKQNNPQIIGKLTYRLSELYPNSGVLKKYHACYDKLAVQNYRDSNAAMTVVQLDTYREEANHINDELNKYGIKPTYAAAAENLYALTCEAADLLQIPRAIMTKAVDHCLLFEGLRGLDDACIYHGYFKGANCRQAATYVGERSRDDFQNRVDRVFTEIDMAKMETQQGLSR